MFSKYILLHPHSTQCPTHLLGWLQQAEQERGRHLMACSLYPITLVSPSLSDPLQPITPSTSHITGSPHFIPAQISAGTLSLLRTTLHPLRPLRRSIRHCSTAGDCCGGTSSLLPPPAQRPVLRPFLPTTFVQQSFGQFWFTFFTRPLCLGSFLNCTDFTVSL